MGRAEVRVASVEIRLSEVPVRLPDGVGPGGPRTVQQLQGRGNSHHTHTHTHTRGGTRTPMDSCWLRLILTRVAINAEVEVC
jgi:hypothetical protein